jgi:hypothetical protein
LKFLRAQVEWRRADSPDDNAHNREAIRLANAGANRTPLTFDDMDWWTMYEQRAIENGFV